MKTIPITAAALAALLACRSTMPTLPDAAAPAAEGHAHGAPAALPPGAPPEEVVPGVSLEGLTDAQKQVVAAYARTAFCYCGCPHRLSDCLRSHGTCKHAPRMAALAARYARYGLPVEAVARELDAYYASFDRRMRVDVAAFGPPLGDAAAPHTIVEFSDFTCPFCQRLRPALERYVTERADRVKLFFKPFPIESHEHALEAAQAAEWGREQGLFWKLHDLLFETTDHSLDALAAAATAAGGDEADLRDALVSGRFLPRVRASQAEARALGVNATPTLLLDGRRVLLPDLSDEMLDFTLEDEADWAAQRSWSRD